MLFYTDHTDKVFAVAWSPVQADIIASGGRDQTVQIWNALSGETISIYSGHHACVLSLAWSPDGVYLASGDTAGLIAIWHTGTGEMLQTYHGHVRFVRSIAWSPDGKYIASGGDYGDSTVQVWAPFHGRLLYTHGQQYRIFAASWSPKSSLIASGSFDGTVHVWDAFTGKTTLIYRGHTGPVYTVAWSPNGLSQEGFWENRQEVGARGVESRGGGLALALPDFSKNLPVKAPKETLLASAGQDVTVHLWDANTGSIRCTYSGHTCPVKALAWSPDGLYVVSGSDDTTLQVWHALTGERVSTYEGHRSWIRAVAWSQDGRYIASASDALVQITPVAVVRGSL